MVIEATVVLMLKGVAISDSICLPATSCLCLIIKLGYQNF
jgi:hypothetical protein